MSMPATEYKRTLPGRSNRDTRLRVLAEHAANAYLDDVTPNSWTRSVRAVDLIDIVHAYAGAVPAPAPRHDSHTNLRMVVRHAVRLYLDDALNQRERERRASALIEVIKVYMRREFR